MDIKCQDFSSHRVKYHKQKPFIKTHLTYILNYVGVKIIDRIAKKSCEINFCGISQIKEDHNSAE